MRPFNFNFVNMVPIFQVLHSEQEDVKQHIEQEARKPFNPGAQCFKPIELVNNSLMLLSLKNENYNFDEACKLVNKSPTLCNQNSANNFNKRLSEPVTFTTATFAQTKFGSTKLKNHSKRNNRSVKLKFNIILSITEARHKTVNTMFFWRLRNVAATISKVLFYFRSPTDFHSILKFKNSNQMMNNQVFLDPTSSSEVTSTINYQNTSHMVNQNLNMDVNSATGKRCGFNPEIKQLPNLLYSRSNEDPKCDQTKPIMDENSNNHPVDYANRFNCDYAGKSRLYRHILVAN